ncbi:MAG: hypothetical protein IPJ74_24595 [Saprospiraceae bacterium]|nr:hypothetical protein [Saprospiraceae bacterium]
MKLFISLAFITLPLAILAQQKFEREDRIKDASVPAQALAFIDSTKVDSRIKWYQEESHLGITIEAKFKYKKSRYSIEFDSTGIIQDIEIEIKTLPKAVLERMNKELDSVFNKYKFQKIQLHYNGSEAVLAGVFEQEDMSNRLNTYYEIIIKGWELKTPKLYEITFDDEGHLIKKIHIIQRNSDNLEY